jgi:hypothetical protein
MTIERMRLNPKPRPHKKRVTPDEVRAWALRNGWTQDAWGHLHKDLTADSGVRPGHYRIKLSKIMARVERQYRSNLDNSLHWLRTVSGYYSAMYIDKNDQLIGLVR